MSESQREDKLLEAAETGNVTLTETLLLLGTNVSARDAMLNTPLHLAAYYGHTDVVRLLINGGAEIDTRKSNGYTPLHLAVSSDSAADMSINANLKQTSVILYEGGNYAQAKILPARNSSTVCVVSENIGLGSALTLVCDDNFMKQVKVIFTNLAGFSSFFSKSSKLECLFESIMDNEDCEWNDETVVEKQFIPLFNSYFLDAMVTNNTVPQLQEGTGFPAPLQLLLLQFLSLALNHVNLSKEGGKSAQEWKNSFLPVNETKDNLFRLEDMVGRILSKRDLQQSHLERLENKIQLLESKIDNMFMAVVKGRDDKTDLLSKLKLQDFEIMYQFQEQGKKLNALQDKLKEENDKIHRTISHFEEELQGLKSNLQGQPKNIKSNAEEEIDNLGSKLLEKLNTLESNLQVKLEILESNLDNKLTTQSESLQFTVSRLEEELKRQEKFVEDKVQTVLKSITNIEKIEFQSQAENSQCQSQMIALSSKYQSVTKELNNSQYVFPNSSHSCHYRRYRTYRHVLFRMNAVLASQLLCLLDYTPELRKCRKIEFSRLIG
ncbi:hypothetical protein ANN_00213 [Periplaneta americana]|uniref:Uncharacterized protein n=1 Tax=Periplaneta americana TaxID=6978 RepID=A0ABQ8TRZ9_PERAM|nr:hypothetical protein ANN_00213 [Periplaneta americana]